jgi:ubiquitin-like protein Pup
VKAQPRRSGRSAGEPEGQAAGASPRLAAKGRALADELDGLLEDIDDALGGGNAEACVKGYVQRGGQ